MAAHIISAILKHDAKVASYRIALLRSINDVVPSYPVRAYHSDVAVPLRALAEYWVAYYWPFANLSEPIMLEITGPAGTKEFLEATFNQ